MISNIKTWTPPALEFGQHQSYKLKILRMEIFGKQTLTQLNPWGTLVYCRRVNVKLFSTTRKGEHAATPKGFSTI